MRCSLPATSTTTPIRRRPRRSSCTASCAAKSAAPHLNIVIIAGNHDSAGRLEAPGPLLEELDVSLGGEIVRDADGNIDYGRLVVPLKDRGGQAAAWCLAVPFLRPGDVPRADGATDAYTEGIALLYRQEIGRAHV